MRRKKDDKRVLRRGNGRDTKKNRRPAIIKRNNNNSRNMNTYRSRNDNWNRNRNRKPKKRSRKTVFLMILVLVAFIIGAGIGVMMSFDQENNATESNETHVENVTVEMTTHLNETEEVVFDESDAVDFNENRSSEILGAEKNPYYYDDGLGH